MRRSIAALYIACSLVFLLFGLAWGQSIYGGIHGFVHDASGEPVAGAAVTVTSLEKGTRVQVRTNRQGHYEFPSLLPDDYDLTVQFGDRKVTTPDISVVADSEALVNPNLPRQGAVTASASPGGSTLKTRADVGITLDKFAIQDLPNFTRNASEFTLLAPGAEIRFQATNPSLNPQQNIQVSLHGQVPSGTALLLDGTDNRVLTAEGAVINPALDSLAEIKITTQSYDAESGQALSGVVAAETPVRWQRMAWHGVRLSSERLGSSQQSAIGQSQFAHKSLPGQSGRRGGGWPNRKEQGFCFWRVSGNTACFQLNTVSERSDTKGSRHLPEPIEQYLRFE